MNALVRRRFNNRMTAELLGVKPGTLRDWRWMGKGPRFVMENGRAYYYEDELAAYQASQEERCSTTERV